MSTSLKKTYGKLVSRVRQGRGLTVSQAAAQLGITPGYLVYVEQGRILPRGIEVQKRILSWARDGITYEGADKVSEAAEDYVPKPDKKNFVSFRVYLPKEGIGRTCKAEAKRLNISMNELAIIAIERLLQAKLDFKHLASAVKAVERARMANILSQSPEIRDLLDIEIKGAVAQGKHTTHFREVEADPAYVTPVQEMLRLLPERLDLAESEEEEF